MALYSRIQCCLITILGLFCGLGHTDIPDYRKAVESNLDALVRKNPTPLALFDITRGSWWRKFDQMLPCSPDDTGFISVRNETLERNAELYWKCVDSTASKLVVTADDFTEGVSWTNNFAETDRKFTFVLLSFDRNVMPSGTKMTQLSNLVTVHLVERSESQGSTEERGYSVKINHDPEVSRSRKCLTWNTVKREMIPEEKCKVRKMDDNWTECICGVQLRLPIVVATQPEVTTTSTTTSAPTTTKSVAKDDILSITKVPGNPATRKPAENAKFVAETEAPEETEIVLTDPHPKNPIVPPNEPFLQTDDKQNRGPDIVDDTLPSKDDLSEKQTAAENSHVLINKHFTVIFSSLNGLTFVVCLIAYIGIISFRDVVERHQTVLNVCCLNAIFCATVANILLVNFTGHTNCQTLRCLFFSSSCLFFLLCGVFWLCSYLLQLFRMMRYGSQWALSLKLVAIISYGVPLGLVIACSLAIEHHSLASLRFIFIFVFTVIPALAILSFSAIFLWLANREYMGILHNLPSLVPMENLSESQQSSGRRKKYSTGSCSINSTVNGFDLGTTRFLVFMSVIFLYGLMWLTATIRYLHENSAVEQVLLALGFLQSIALCSMFFDGSNRNSIYECFRFTQGHETGEIPDAFEPNRETRISHEDMNNLQARPCEKKRKFSDYHRSFVAVNDSENVENAEEAYEANCSRVETASRV